MSKTFGHFLLGFVIFLASPSDLICATMAAHKVSKSAVVEVPEGMKLIRDNTGQRWLLPIEMNAPPERKLVIRYFTAKTTPQVLRKIGNHIVLSGPLSALDTIVSTSAHDPNSLMRRLPKALADLMELEKGANLHAKQSKDLQALGVFGPAEFTTFKIPYIPMPAEEFEFSAISSYAQAETKALVSFTENGQKFYRFFIHPNHVDAYEDLIKKFGIVYHYDAISSSSPRSLVVTDPDHDDYVHWIKPSIHRKIDGSVRINIDTKARRAILMSEAIHEIPAETLKSYGVQFMLEPAVFQPKGKIASTIHREVAPELMHSDANVRWIPAFILQNTGADAVPGLNLEEMIKASGDLPEHFVRERIVRPLLRTYVSMGLVEGLPGELHTQNFYYKVVRAGSAWLPTGEIMLKDNDGFRYDTELALRKGRNLRFFAKFDKPFYWGKFSSTIGLGKEGIPFLGSWYYKLIRNVNGFETLSAYMMRALQKIDTTGVWDNARTQLMFDDIAMQEAYRLTGIEIVRSEYGFGYSQGLNLALKTYRTRLSSEADTLDRLDLRLQSLLSSEWVRLAANDRRSSLRRALPKDAYYLLHTSHDQQFVIEARTPRTTLSNPDPNVGFAIVETQASPEGARFRALIKEYDPNSKSFLFKSTGLSCETLFSGGQ